PGGAPPASTGGVRAAGEPRLLPPGGSAGRRTAGRGARPAARHPGVRRCTARRRARAARAPACPMSGSVMRAARALLPNIADYRGLRRTWRGDLLAGLTVGVV